MTGVAKREKQFTVDPTDSLEIPVAKTGRPSIEEVGAGNKGVDRHARPARPRARRARRPQQRPGGAADERGLHHSPADRAC